MMMNRMFVGSEELNRRCQDIRLYVMRLPGQLVVARPE
jgi:hypothetical protein